jgi:hypothetical protein
VGVAVAVGVALCGPGAGALPVAAAPSGATGAGVFGAAATFGEAGAWAWAAVAALLGAGLGTAAFVCAGRSRGGLFRLSQPPEAARGGGFATSSPGIRRSPWRLSFPTRPGFAAFTSFRSALSCLAIVDRLSPCRTTTFFSGGRLSLTGRSTGCLTGRNEDEGVGAVLMATTWSVARPPRGGHVRSPAQRCDGLPGTGVAERVGKVGGLETTRTMGSSSTLLPNPEAEPPTFVGNDANELPGRRPRSNPCVQISG